MSTLIEHPTRILFFTGKGGVGKTSAACATAIGLADAGGRVLLVSTDPASNLDEVLRVKLSAAPTAVPSVPGLSALNIDPVQAAHDYRERVVGPYRGVLPAVAVASIEEQLSGACTVEIAATTAAFDHVIFDTAPTGHTLRLLELPAAWSTFIDATVGGTSCLGPLSGLSAQKALYAASNEALRDPAQTTLVLVARPDRSSLAEAERTRGELAQLGVSNVRLILNGVFQARDTSDATAVAMEARGRASLEAIPAGLRGLARVDVPLLPFGLVVIDTAPTGHTLLLLDAAESYHREVLRKPSGSPEAVQRLLPRLRDPEFTHVLLVTLPEATPIHEAMQLERDLARADIKPFAWVVNQSLTPLAVTDPVLRSRRGHEAVHLQELVGHAARVVLEPWSASYAPRGAVSAPGPAMPTVDV